MESQPRLTARPKGPSMQDYALVCLGFAAFFNVTPLSSLGTAALGLHVGTQEQLLWARVVFILGAAGGIWYRRRHRRGCDRRLCPACLLASFALLYLSGSVATGSWEIWAYTFLLGLATGPLMARWMERLCDFHRTAGRLPCIVTLGSAFLVATACAGLAGTISQNAFLTACTMAFFGAVAWACLEAATRRETLRDAPPPGKSEFRPTGYTSAIVACLGVTWSLAYNLAPLLGFATPRDLPSTAAVLLAYAVCQAVILVAVWKAGVAKVHFGLMLRWLVAIIGVCWSFMPILVEVAPFLGCMATVVTFLVESMAIDIFVIELAGELRLELAVVFYKLAFSFLASACTTSVLFWLIRSFVPSALFATSVTAVAITATLASLPLLPPRNATASLFTLESIPEDESSRGKEAQTLQFIVESCGLTPREGQILEAVVQGYSRDEIAQRFSISSWTVKNHMRGVYSKTQIHSTQELMARVYAHRNPR